MWHAFNLVRSGDSLRSTTVRKVTTESSTGSSSSSRVRTMLTISVEDVDFDVLACVLRVKGRNIQENQYVKVGTCTGVSLIDGLQYAPSSAIFDVLTRKKCTRSVYTCAFPIVNTSMMAVDEAYCNLIVTRNKFVLSQLTSLRRDFYSPAAAYGTG